MKRILLPVMAVMCMLTACNNNTKPEEKEATTTPKEETAPASKWTYNESGDEMSGKKVHTAILESADRYELEFPYKEDGGSKFALGINHTDTTSLLLLTVSTGRFDADIKGRGNMRLKFDDSEPWGYNYMVTSNGKDNVIIFMESEVLVPKVKAAKKVLIEAPFVGNGTKVLHFDVEGLKWEH